MGGGWGAERREGEAAAEHSHAPARPCARDYHSDLLSFDILSPHRRCLEHKVLSIIVITANARRRSSRKAADQLREGRSIQRGVRRAAYISIMWISANDPIRSVSSSCSKGQGEGRCGWRFDIRSQTEYKKSSSVSVETRILVFIMFSASGSFAFGVRTWAATLIGAGSTVRRAGRPGISPER